MRNAGDEPGQCRPDDPTDLTETGRGFHVHRGQGDFGPSNRTDSNP